MFRSIRRHPYLSLIFFSSLAYFLYKTRLLEMLFLPSYESIEERVMEIRKLRAPKSIKWQEEELMIIPDANDTEAQRPFSCRNTRQGKYLITDDRGFTCRRGDVMKNGCCRLDKDSRPYACHNCTKGCCATYEMCVACCLKPTQKELLENVIREATGARLKLLLAVKDHFELCGVKCRTSSVSVHQENKYKNPQYKYCYGHEPPAPTTSSEIKR